MAFDYSKTGLPANPKWEKAAETCHDWVMKFMGHKYGADGVANFMLGQPVAAAKRIIDNCPDWSEESVTLALLGPVKGQIAQQCRGNFDAVQQAQADFGFRAAELLIAAGNNTPTDHEMVRDMRRLFLAESVSMMEDQMVDRKHWDQHHDMRWKILGNMQAQFEQAKGKDVALDKIFEETLLKSTTALSAIDAKRKQPKGPGL